MSGFVKDQSGSSSNSGAEALLINTDLSLKDESVGGPLLNLSGQVVGFNIRSSASSVAGSFIPANVLSGAITAAEAKK